MFSELPEIRGSTVYILNLYEPQSSPWQRGLLLQVLHLFPIVEHRVEDSSEQLEVHDKVQQMYGEVKRVGSETKETEAAVEYVVEHHLQVGVKNRELNTLHMM